MANALISINFANNSDLIVGNSTNKSVNPAGLKNTLQSGPELYDVHLNNVDFDGNIDVAGGSFMRAVSSRSLAVGTAVAGSVGTITATSNISAGGVLVFGNSGGNVVGTNSIGARTVSTTVPTVCGVSGDIWYTVY